VSSVKSKAVRDLVFYAVLLFSATVSDHCLVFYLITVSDHCSLFSFNCFAQQKLCFPGSAVRLHPSLPCSGIFGSIFKIAISSVIYLFELSFVFRLLR
jgi:hypothetical protein